MANMLYAAAAVGVPVFNFGAYHVLHAYTYAVCACMPVPNATAAAAAAVAGVPTTF
jgi:hypothetical protein